MVKDLEVRARYFCAMMLSNTAPSISCVSGWCIWHVWNMITWQKRKSISEMLCYALHYVVTMVNASEAAQQVEHLWLEFPTCGPSNCPLVHSQFELWTVTESVFYSVCRFNCPRSFQKVAEKYTFYFEFIYLWAFWSTLICCLREKQSTWELDGVYWIQEKIPATSWKLGLIDYAP